MSSGINWFKYSTPQAFYPLAGAMVPWFFAAAALFAVAGLYIGFFVAPTDFQQGEAYRIIFLHVPAAWMSMFLYVVMAFWAGVGLALGTRLSAMMASALAPTGALMTFLALWSGSLWGKPTWGACCSSTSASWRSRRRSTMRAAPTAPARCWRWSAWSTCRSSISRCSGGTRCTRGHR
jgi:ABC-type transport system involved in cytochrome c biogenesis permease subunit